MLRLRPRPSRSVRRPGSRRIRRWLGAAAAILATALLAPPTGRAAPPDEGECPTLEATPEEIRNGMDATALAVKEGMTIDQEKLLVLHRLLPPEIWRHREVFFFEGMRMRVGY